MLGLKWTQDGLLDGEAAASVLCDDAQTRTGGRVLCKYCLVKIGMSLDQGAGGRSPEESRPCLVRGLATRVEGPVEGPVIY